MRRLSARIHEGVVPFIIGLFATGAPVSKRHISVWLRHRSATQLRHDSHVRVLGLLPLGGRGYISCHLQLEAT